MTSSINRQNIQHSFDHLFNVISGERFLEMRGLNNEIPFFICPFEPANSVDMEKFELKLAKQLQQAGVKVLEINLYDLSIELLKARGIWQQIIDSEGTFSKNELLELFQNVLDPADNLIPAISEKLRLQEYDVLFITGVGEVFPFLRSHSVLNNLQSTAKDKPTLMFFPGVYSHSLESGASLDLFGRLHDDKYYRAFNILDREP